MDVFSAALMYLAVHISHELSQLVVLGNWSTEALADRLGNIERVGNEELISVDTRLANAVDEFNSTVALFALGAEFRTDGNSFRILHVP